MIGETNVGASSYGVHIADTPPRNTKMLWVDTSEEGIVKYYNGVKWTPTKSVWG